MTDPPSVMGVWVALEDATVENGCLYALPKSHKGPLSMRWGRVGDGAVDVLDGGGDKAWDLNAFIPLAVKAGTLVLLHGYLVHHSYENHSDKSRHAYTVHYIEGTQDHKWKEENWLQRPADFPFVPLYSDGHC